MEILSKFEQKTRKNRKIFSIEILSKFEQKAEKFQKT